MREPLEKRCGGPGKIRAGEVRQVLCVHAMMPPMVCRPVWWPTAGPWHEDREWIGFDLHHFHIDWRFVAQNVIDGIVKKNGRPYEKGHGKVLSSQVIVAEMIIPEGGSVLDRRRQDGLPEGKEDQWMKWQGRICVNEDPASWHESEKWVVEWFGKLENAYQDTDLVRKGHRLFCPHKGMELTDMTVAGDGTIECPLHGLKWCVASGRLRVQGQLPGMEKR